MAKKFMVFTNPELEPVIVLDDVYFHRDIMMPDNCTRRAGGGYWRIDNEGTLHLYDLSGDFGKYSESAAQEAFDNKRVTLAEEQSFEELGIKKLEMR